MFLYACVCARVGLKAKGQTFASKPVLLPSSGVTSEVAMVWVELQESHRKTSQNALHTGQGMSGRTTIPRPRPQT